MLAVQGAQRAANGTVALGARSHGGRASGTHRMGLPEQGKGHIKIHPGHKREVRSPGKF